MKAVYYFDPELNVCPVKEYLSRYYIENGADAGVRNKNLNLLVNIDAKINYVLANFGRSLPPISHNLDRSFNFLETRQRKNKNILIRIFYFRYDEMIVLLGCLEKLDNYDNKKEKNKIYRELLLIQSFQNKFISNPELYEEYKKTDN